MDIGNIGVEDVFIQNTENKIAEMKRAERVAKAKACKEEIDKAAEEFEAVFISQMMQHMFAGVTFNPMTGDKSPGDEIYKSLLIDEYGKMLTKAGGIGIADHVKREMLKVQEIE